MNTKIKLGELVVCPNCNRYFNRIGYNQKYCSKQCREKLTIEKNENTTRSKFYLFNRDDFKCVYCGKSSIEDGVKLVIDHLIPYRKTHNNSIYNLVTSCNECNLSKSITTLNIEVYNRIIERNKNLNKGISESMKKELEEFLSVYFNKQKNVNRNN